MKAELYDRNMQIYLMRESGLSLREIAQKFKISKERVRQISYKIWCMINKKEINIDNRLNTYNEFRLFFKNVKSDRK